MTIRATTPRANAATNRQSAANRALISRLLGVNRPFIGCPSRIRCQAATRSWTKSRQWEIQRTLFSSARATVWPPAKVNGVWPFNDAWLRTSVVVGPTPGATQRCLNPGFSERIRNSRRTGYHRQGRVENAFFRYKSIIGDGLRARGPAGQGSEVVLGREILNRMSEFVRPVSYRLGR